MMDCMLAHWFKARSCYVLEELHGLEFSVLRQSYNGQLNTTTARLLPKLRLAQTAVPDVAAFAVDQRRMRR